MLFTPSLVDSTRTKSPAVLPVMNTLNIAIAGAGLLGRLLAWRLLLRGHHVTLLEAGRFDKPVSAAHTAAAMISPLSEVVISERSIYDMGMASLRLWPQLIEQLQTETAAIIRYSANGSIVVAHQQDLSELQQFKQDLQARLGIDDHSEWLDAQTLAQQEPALQHFGRGLLLPGEAYLDNRKLLQTLLDRIQTLGAHSVESCPVTIDGQALQTADGVSDQFDLIIDCRGIGAKQSLPTLRGLRGEVLWVETAEISLQHAVRLMHPRYKLYIVPKPMRQFIIGATEIESEDRSPISVQSYLELASALYTVNPAFAEARVIESDVNLRPAFADNLPAIVEEGRILHVNGLYRHGYLLAPVMVNRVMEKIDTFSAAGSNTSSSDGTEQRHRA